MGSSIGGWIALEMVVRDEKEAVGALILIDSMEITVDGDPITDFSAILRD